MGVGGMGTNNFDEDFENRMSQSKKTITYTAKGKYLGIIGNYLGKNSAEYAFSIKKGEEKSVCFIDNQKRIFAILNPDIKEVELAPYVDLKILDGVEKILFSGGRE